MEKQISQTGLDAAIGKYPTLKAFSDALGVSYQLVQQWRINGVPADYCPEIEKLTGVMSETLNSDVDWAFIRSSLPDRSRHTTDTSPSPNKATP